MTDQPSPPPAHDPDPEADAKDTRRMKAVLLTAATIAFVSVPLVVPFNGFAPDAFPVPQEDPPIQPAGYAFSLWGLIYLWMLAHSLFGLVSRSEDVAWDGVRWPLVVSLILGAAWLPVAQFSPVWATVMIWAMLLSALAALLRTPAGQDRWLLRAPIALYAGWLTAASWVAIGLLGAGNGLGPGQIGWAWIGLAGALATALAVTRVVPRAPVYAAAVIWALIGVAVANWGVNWALVAVSLGGAVLVAAPSLERLRAG
ncbi:MAG: hypothetical protein AAGG09_17315 [Pseudomonadota bacterium]